MSTRREIPYPATSDHVVLYLLCKHTDDDVFNDFPKISEYLPKISEDSPEVVLRPDKRF